MEKLKQTWNKTYDKRNPRPYKDKGYRAFIIGLVMGLIIGAAITAFLLITYSIFFN